VTGGKAGTGTIGWGTDVDVGDEDIVVKCKIIMTMKGSSW
jgi:hypothetical protein